MPKQQKDASRKWAMPLVALSAGAVVAAIYFLVLPYQRELLLVAADDVRFFDGADRTKIIFHVRAGKTAHIVSCDDRKSTIEPLIELDDGRKAYVLEGHYRLRVVSTGLLSKPEAMSCRVT
jgi:hypothetical protein